MHSTSLSLLQRIVSPDNSSERDAAWAHFADLYTPLLLAWSLKQRLQDADAADFVQEVLLHLSRVLPEYRRVEGHRFRDWLFTVVRHLYSDFRTQRKNRTLPGTDGLSGFEDSVPPDLVADMDEHEYRLRLTRRCLEMIQGDFTPLTWNAFRLLAVEGRPVAEVVSELGITDDAAHSARRRVVERIREELADFLESE
jgi:RNA polymerase sigma-70 factor (ECF subfamily)